MTRRRMLCGSAAVGLTISAAVIVSGPPSLGAQKGVPPSFRTEFTAKTCPSPWEVDEEGFAPGRLAHQGYQYYAPTWVWADPTPGTRKAYAPADGADLVDISHQKKWTSPRITQNCWREVWLNPTTGWTYVYTAFTGRVQEGTVVDYGGELVQAQCSDGSYVDDPSGCPTGGGGGGGGGGGSGGPSLSLGQYLLCHLTLWSDGSKTLDWCQGPFDY